MPFNLESLDKTAFLASALTGGLAGSFLTLVTQGVSRYWNRPILAIVAENDEPGCRVRTRGDSDNPKVHFGYLRLKIENRGRSYAQGVAVCVTHIVFRAAGSGEKSFAEEVFDLKTALTGCLTFDLASGSPLVRTILDLERAEG